MYCTTSTLILLYLSRCSFQCSHMPKSPKDTVGKTLLRSYPRVFHCIVVNLQYVDWSVDIHLYTRCISTTSYM